MGTLNSLARAAVPLAALLLAATSDAAFRPHLDNPVAEFDAGSWIRVRTVDALPPLPGPGGNGQILTITGHPPLAAVQNDDHEPQRGLQFLGRVDIGRDAPESLRRAPGARLVTIPVTAWEGKGSANGAPDGGPGLTEARESTAGVTVRRGLRAPDTDDDAPRVSPVSDPAEETGTRQTGYPINELPMYGEGEKTPFQKQADERFIEMMMARFQSRAVAAEHFAQIGWNGYYAGDKSFAIRRFNQAWLLDPHNRHALWGFAVISLERGEVESAIRFYEMALDNGPEDPVLRAEYEALRGRHEDSWP